NSQRREARRTTGPAIHKGRTDHQHENCEGAWPQRATDPAWPRRRGDRISFQETSMPEAFICDGVRTPIGRYGGALAKVRTDDLAAIPIKVLMARHPKLDWSKLDDVFMG